MRIIVLLLLSISVLFARGQSNHQLLKRGDQSYLKQDYNRAEENYRRALENKQEEKTKYNLGNTVMEQNRPDEAIPLYEQAAKKQSDLTLRSRAWHNLGNAYYLKKDYQNSVNAYKEALKVKPDDLDTKKNLVLAKKQLLKQQQQERQQQKQDQQPNEDQQDQQPNPQGEDQQGQQKQQKEKMQNKTQEMSREEAEQLLQYTEREDQRVQKKLRNKNDKTPPPKKDW